MPQIPDDAGLPLNANGPAYTSRQDRDGVPLSYVGEKLGLAIADLHRYARRCQGDRDDLRCAMYGGLKSELQHSRQPVKSANGKEHVPTTAT